jgi:uncharacterized membrane protein
MVKGTPWEGHLAEWLNIVVRSCISHSVLPGSALPSILFLENASTERMYEMSWRISGLYTAEDFIIWKNIVAPKTIPKHLHWFKYEAYFTSLSSFALLFIIYYFNASAMLIDTNVLKLTAAQAVGISIGSFIIAWFIYDLLCKSPLKKALALCSHSIIILIGFAYFYSHVFSGRAAFIHFGAMIGSIMVANVFFVIIPSQKAMVNAAKKDYFRTHKKERMRCFVPFIITTSHCRYCCYGQQSFSQHIW